MEMQITLYLNVFLKVDYYQTKLWLDQTTLKLYQDSLFIAFKSPV